MGKKVAMMLGLDLSDISRGDLSEPLRLQLGSRIPALFFDEGDANKSDIGIEVIAKPS